MSGNVLQQHRHAALSNLRVFNFIFVVVLATREESEKLRVAHKIVAPPSQPRAAPAQDAIPPAPFPTSTMLSNQTRPTHQIVGTQFFVMPSSMARKWARVHVHAPEIQRLGVPSEGSCVDLKMGPTSTKFGCSTCGKSMHVCSGHYGHIQLPSPVFHPGFVDECVLTLRCVCRFCSALVVEPPAPPTHYKRTLKQALSKAATLRRTKTVCPECGGQQPSYSSIRSGVGVQQAWTDVTFEDEEEAAAAKEWSAAIAYEILQNISDEDATKLGFAGLTRPESLMADTIVVAPNKIRPGVRTDDGRGENALTLACLSVLKSAIKAKQKPTDTSLNAMQSVVASYLDKTVSSGTRVKQVGRCGDRARGVSARLKGKRGRMRGNVLGKRVNYSARSVITASWREDVTTATLPLRIAAGLTKPEHVNRFNHAELQRLVNASVGSKHGDYPRAYSVERTDGRLINVDRVPPHKAARLLRLKPGDVVHRTLKNGDTVLLNRQPSLHRNSIMAHSVIVDESGADVIRLPIADTTPYNADFDGDEMNVHVLQTTEAAVEAQKLMSIEACLLNDSGGGVTISPVQDGMLSLYKLSQPGVFFTRDEFWQLWAQAKYPHPATPPPPALMPQGEEPQWTGMQLLSCLLPEWFNYDRFGVLIRDGQLLQGTLTKKHLGSGPLSLSSCMARADSTAYVHFISDAQRVGCTYLREVLGFSVGIRDFFPPTQSSVKAKKIIKQACYAVDQAVKEWDGEPDEGALCFAMNRVLPLANAAMDECLQGTALSDMIRSGAKGKLMNPVQIGLLVGQQSVHGFRPAPPQNFDRTLPHFKHGETSAQSRGFVTGTFLNGLSCTEEFFHQQSAREGLFNSACKTADSGYLYRKVRCAIEGCAVSHDGSVLDAAGNVVTDLYGGDGFSASRLLPASVLTVEDVEAATDAGYISCADAESVHKLAVQCTRLRNDKLGPFYDPSSSPPPPRLPFDPAELAHAASRIINSGTATGTTGTTTTTTGMSLAAQSFAQDTTVPPDARLAFCMLPAIAKSEFSCAQWDVAADRARHSVTLAKADAGMPVGVLAASSMGQLLSQMTLNTFHSTGVFNETVSLGLPRLNFIISGSKSGKGSEMRVMMADGADEGEAGASALNLLNKLRCIVLGDLVTSVCVGATLDGSHGARSILHRMDAALLDTDDAARAKIHITIDKLIAVQRELTIKQVAQRVRERVRGMEDAGADAVVTCSTENARVWELVIRSNRSEDSEDNNENVVVEKLEAMAGDLLSTRISGIPCISGGTVKMGVQGRYCSFIGSDLMTALALPGVMHAESTDVAETLAVFGVEAARDCLMREFRRAMAQTSYSSERHAGIVASFMTRNGYLCGTTRHGFKRSGLSGATTAFSAMRRFGFETFMVEAYDAAASSERVNCVTTALTESMCAGIKPRFGTGGVDLIPVLPSEEVHARKKAKTARRRVPVMHVNREDNLRHYVGASDSKHAKHEYRGEWRWSPTTDVEEALSNIVSDASVGDAACDEVFAGDVYEGEGYAPFSPVGAGATTAGCAPTSPVAVYAPMSPMDVDVEKDDVYAPTSPIASATTSYAPMSP